MRVKLLKDIQIEEKIELDLPIDEAPIPVGNPNVLVGDAFCKFIYGDVLQGSWMCCGQPVKKNSWCDYHAGIVYEPPNTKLRVPKGA